MANDKHTPGELHTGGTFNPGTDNERQWLWSLPAPGCQSGEVIAKDMTPANAERLAHCWNMHDALLAACEDALATGERDMQHILDNGRLRDVLRAAIAKARGA